MAVGRRHLHGAAWRLLVACLLCQPAAARAQKNANVPTPTPAEAEGQPRSYMQQSMTKLRPGSLLVGDTILFSAVDLRSELEQLRDAEVVKHYSRLGQIDVIADLGEKEHLAALQERAEVSRRNETQRYYAAMQAYRTRVWRSTAPGPS